MKRLERFGISIHRAGRPGDVIQSVPPSWAVRHEGRRGVPRYEFYATKREAEHYARALADMFERIRGLV